MTVSFLSSWNGRALSIRRRSSWRCWASISQRNPTEESRARVDRSIGYGEHQALRIHRVESCRFVLWKKTGTSRMNLIQETQGWYWNSWMWRTVNEMPTLPPDRVSFYRLLVMRIGCLSQDGPDSVWHAKLQARTKRILSVWEDTWEVGPAWSRSSIRNITAMRSPCTSMRILLHVYQRDALRVV